MQVKRSCMLPENGQIMDARGGVGGVVGRRRPRTRPRRGVDSNRVVRETAAMLDALLLGVGLVDVDALDPAEIGGWVASLSASIRGLNGLVRQLKDRKRGAAGSGGQAAGSADVREPVAGAADGW